MTRIYVIEQAWNGKWYPLVDEDCVGLQKEDLEQTLEDLRDTEPETEFRITIFERKEK
jgi:hypothetical protein